MDIATDCIKLINEASRILEHQKEISTLKGENFNIFSILKLESKENATHSAFLGELLDPKGSHNLGSLFLKLFLETLDINHINIENSHLILEFYLGERNDREKTGGRVDIFIEDKDFKTICIENKIYAPDQNVQIQRYCNHNGENNLVYYLTLEGDEPGIDSKGKLKSGEHFHLLSYATDIVNWLEKCAKEANNLPILRESIRQYIILIKKLTNQLTDSKMKNEIQDLIIRNYEATTTIQANIPKVELEFAKNFLQEVKLKLKDLFHDNKWNITTDENLEKPWKGLSIIHKDWPESVRVKLEGQSKLPWSNSIYGIIGNKSNCDRNILNSELAGVTTLREGFKSSDVWPYYKTILYFGAARGRSELFDEEKRAKLVEELSKKLYDLSKACEEPLKRVKNNVSVKNNSAIDNLN